MMAVLIFLLMFFNFFYYRFAVKRIKDIKSESASLSRREVLSRISEAGRPSLFSGLAFGVCAVIVLSLGFQMLNNYLGIVIN
jgi:Na+-driven multidrug efflux pump